MGARVSAGGVDTQGVDSELVALWVQVAAVLAALVGAGVALVVSARERANTRRIAREDRFAAAQLAEAMFQLDVLLRLLENQNRGGSSDRQEAERMGSEALTLIGAAGPELLPGLYEKRVGEEAKLRAHLADEDWPEWKRNAIETQVALSQVTARLRSLARPED